MEVIKYFAGFPTSVGIMDVLAEEYHYMLLVNVCKMGTDSYRIKLQDPSRFSLVWTMIVYADGCGYYMHREGDSTTWFIFV